MPAVRYNLSGLFIKSVTTEFQNRTRCNLRNSTMSSTFICTIANFKTRNRL